MTALLELRDIRRSYPSGDGNVEVLKGITLSYCRRRDGGYCRGLRLREIHADEYSRLSG